MIWFQKHRVFSLVLVLCVPGVAAAMLSLPDDEGKEISVKELPAAIQQALKGVDTDEVEVTSAGYEIEIEEDGIGIELQLDKDGRLLGIEIEEDDDDERDDEDAENAKIVDLNSLPAAAREAIRKFAAGNRIEMVEQEAKNGQVLFEALWKVAGVAHEATVTAQGVLVELEEVTTAAAIPEDVRKLSARHFKDGKDMKFERKLIAAYEIEGVVNGQTRELLVTSTGAEIEIKFDGDE